MNTRKYANLTDLLANNPQASRFFSKLPAYVQSSIQERGNDIQSEDMLHRYADNLTAGDK